MADRAQALASVEESFRPKAATMALLRRRCRPSGRCPSVSSIASYRGSTSISRVLEEAENTRTTRCWSGLRFLSIFLPTTSTNFSWCASPA